MIELTENNYAAYVRGLTFDGEKGLFVHATEGVVPSFVFQGPSLGWKAAFDARLQESGEYPAVVGFEGSSLLLALGSSYDEALAAAGVSARPGAKASAARGDVVRDKICLVTGGAQGFGEGMVRALVANGAFVYIADMNFAGAQALSAALNAEAGRTVALPLEVNVSSEESTAAMFDRIGRLTGGLDLYVSNAGVLRAGSVKEMPLKDFSFVTSVDYIGFFVGAKHAARMLEVQNRAAGAYPTDIVCISSKSGLQGSNKNGAYAGAKFGVIGLVQSFALELVADNVKVNAICPGNFLDGPLWSDPKRGLFVQYLEAGKVPGAKTVADVRRSYEAKVPMGRGCRTEDVIRALLYIVEQKYETGQALPVTGGQVMLN